MRTIPEPREAAAELEKGSCDWFNDNAAMCLWKASPSSVLNTVDEVLKRYGLEVVLWDNGDSDTSFQILPRENEGGAPLGSVCTYERAYNTRHKAGEERAHMHAHLAGLAAVGALVRAQAAAIARRNAHVTSDGEIYVAHKIADEIEAGNPAPSSPGVPDSARAPDDLTREQIRGRAKALLVKNGWKPGDNFAAQNVIELMATIGMSLLTDPPEDRCAYPECGCDADSVCSRALSAHPAGQSEDDNERCIACDKPLKAGERVLPDAEGGTIHTACCGPERESYTKGDGEPLGPNDPIPQGYVYETERPAGQSEGCDWCLSLTGKRDPHRACAKCAPPKSRPAPDSTRTGQVETEEDWRDDPSADERWCAGVDYAQKQLCHVLDIDPDSVCWDAATETLDRDIQAVICTILAAWAGDDWQALAACPADPEAQGADDGPRA